MRILHDDVSAHRHICLDEASGVTIRTIDKIIDRMDIVVSYRNFRCLKLFSRIFQIVPLFKKRMLLPLKC